MTFLEARLSDDITRKSKGGPTVPGRTKIYTHTGKLKQNFTSSTALHKYDLSYGIKTKADFEEVLAAYHVVLLTPYEGFRHKDWNDYQADEDNSTLTLISGTTWQLQRKYVFGGVTLKRDITKPVAGVAVYNAGGGLLTGTVDTTLGTFTGAGTPAYWVGEFDVPVTFSDDALDSIELDGIDGDELLGLPSIRLEEIRL